MILACTVIDVVCGAYLLLLRGGGGATSGHPTVLVHDSLPFQSTYDRLLPLYGSKANTTAHRPDVINLPRVLVHVDSSSPRKNFPLWPDRYPTEGGMVPFNERRVRVTPEVRLFI